MSAPSSDPCLALASSLVQQSRESLVATFLERSRTGNPRARNLHGPVLADHLPEFLSALAATLRSPTPRSPSPTHAPHGDPIEDAARAHARQRVHESNYTPRQVIEEFALMRSIVVASLRAGGAWNASVEEAVDGAFTEAVCSSIDTFQRECDAALSAVKHRCRAEERFLSTLLEGVPLGLCLVEAPTGRILLHNELAERILGHAFPETPDVESYGAFSAIRADGTSYAPNEYPTARALTGEVILREPMIYRRGDGSIVHLEVSSAPVIDPSDRIIAAISVWNDVTGSVELVANLEAHQRKLEREKVVRERFVATLSHDMRTPLIVIRMAAEALGFEAALPSGVLALLDKIKSNVSRADRMIRDLLDADALSRGSGVRVDAYPFDLATLVRSVAGDLALAHGPRFLVRAHGDTSGSWDEDALRRVIENLCGNAIKYGAPRAPVSIAVEDRGALVALSVHNEGEPLAEGEREALFRPFERINQARTSRPGWGIGLTLVKGFVEAHGGRVEVESAPMVGTTFRVMLPRTHG